ncbi:MAG: EAL domain-containing protein [Desulfuromonadales bacterium]|nr:EAL domain-containing protein [Desulfuromonadales bacterium]
MLIVDDQQEQLKSVQLMLKINGYEDVDLASGGEEAIRKLQCGCYQLLLLDLQMPGATGLNVLDHIRQAGHATETIVLSGESSFEWVKEAMRLGAHDYIRKPYKPAELLSAISKAREQYYEKQLLQKKLKSINYLAYHDLLTGLPNRALFLDRVNQTIARAQRHEQQFALIFIDMDRFKSINDTLGHLIGDRVLQLVANRILGCLRAEDTLCRFGGDEFALLLPDISDQQGIATVAKKILDEIRKTFLIDRHQLHLRASLGVAVYPTTGTTSEALLHNADIAMYHIKSSSRDSYSFYTDAMKEETVSNAAERDLRQALEENQFRVHFQPQFNPHTRAVVGLEALLRRHHPHRGIIYPEEFLPVAEEAKLLLTIESLVLRQVCKTLAQWHHQGFRNVPVSLNISPIQLEQEGFVENFLGTLTEFDLGPELFNLEITEESLLKGQKLIAHNIKALRERGIAITVDDFGRGFLPLSYLQYVAVSALKIDRAFVRELGKTPQSSRLIDGIAMMAKGMKLNLAADGIEELEQLDHLSQLGCEKVQGFFFSGALPQEKIAPLLTRRTADEN